MENWDVGQLSDVDRDTEAPAPSAGGPGFVYVISNPSMPDLVKIGLTARPVEARMYDLQSTGVPTPFAKEYAIHVDDARAVEQKVHRLLDTARVSANREFFKITPSLAKDAVLESALGHVTNADALADFAAYHDSIHADQERHFAGLLEEERKRTIFWRRLAIAFGVPTVLFVTLLYVGLKN